MTAPNGNGKNASSTRNGRSSVVDALASGAFAREYRLAGIPETKGSAAPVVAAPAHARPEASVRRTTSAVLSTWNKKDELRENLASLRTQTEPFREIIVVDNCSGDGTEAMVRGEFPEVIYIRTAHDRVGACETFNMGFRRASGDYVAILDDDIVMPRDWHERTRARLEAEPETTAVVSTNVVEPEMPEWYVNDPEVNRERYMCTFRGCASLARRKPLLEAGGYDERFFIYGNERDLATRLLNRGHRILQYGGTSVFHRTPFGMKAGRRSLYFHVRNLWWYFFKYVGFWDIVRFFAIQLLLKLRWRKVHITADAIGTIGIYQVIRSTPRGWWVVAKATLDAFAGMWPCLAARRVCRHPDFSLPTK